MLPGCGVVQHMTGDENGSVTLDITTLYKFMIVISDTTATNALYKHYGNDKVIAALKELGLKGTQFNRAFYDSVREEQGIQNYFEALYHFRGESLDKKKILEMFKNPKLQFAYNFTGVAKEFKLIEEDTKTISIHCEP